MPAKLDPAALLGQPAPAGDPACIQAECFCLVGADKKCALILHIQDDQPCVCVKDDAGTVKHVKVSEVLALIKK